ncbi:MULTISPECIES: fructosamine kinase family protein [Haloferax]|uniref:Phosphotransferase n=1 Tax=Haloferax marinum TaxID=2666143 RepID=A0A6A8G6N2_9EURY|nr:MULTISPECIES: fructosamine kinase family protein [Haloferax]KAB1196766.1 fructosamine kinase family protein [Haloferax sp. CBA1150]MRW95776.1 phosphotransferase [Haloferax marinum]
MDAAAVVERVVAVLEADADPHTVTELDGGHVGQVFALHFPRGESLVAKVGPTPLDVEGAMLTSLARAGLPVPTVHYADEDLLVLDYVDGDAELDSRAERDLARHLASLHDTTAPAFGFPYDTLSGPYDQPNPWTDSWVEFFGDQRLRPWCAAATSSGLPESMAERIDAIASDLGDLLTEPDAPRLVHGDVWEGNLVVREGRVAAFLDPACYYAHPEVELAYIEWFDSAGDDFFETYTDLRPLDPGFFDERAPVYALFPLLEHVRVFGSDYVPEIRDAVEAIGY